MYYMANICSEFGPPNLKSLEFYSEFQLVPKKTMDTDKLTQNQEYI